MAVKAILSYFKTKKLTFFGGGGGGGVSPG